MIKKEKTCKKCKQKKPSASFYSQQQRGKNGQIWKYLDSYCKTCRLEYGSKRRKLIKTQAVEYLGGKCQDCGTRDKNKAIYDFHHIKGDKDFTISKTSKSLESIKKELDKCILLCANCHRKRHY